MVMPRRPEWFVDAARMWLGAVPVVSPDPGGERTHPMSTAVPSSYIWVSTTGNDTTGDGSQGNPFRTIQKGVTQSSAGVQINVKAGTYSEHVNLGARSGSSVSAPIWLKSIDGDALAWVTPPSTGNDTIKANGVEYWVIEGMKVTCPLSTSWNGIKSTQATSDYTDLSRYVVIRKCTIYCPLGSGDGLKLGAGCENLYIHYNTIFGDGGNGPEQGIDMVACNDSEVYYNDLYAIGGSACIQVKGGSTNVEIVGNTVHDAPGTSVDGVHIGGDTGTGSFRPGFDTYEAYNVNLRQGSISNIGKRAVWFMGAQSCLMENIPITNVSGAFEVELLASTQIPHNCSSITIRNNQFDASGWLKTNTGQGTGLSSTGNTPANA